MSDQPLKSDIDTPCKACGGTMKITMVEPIPDERSMGHTFVCSCGATEKFKFPRAARV